MKYIFIVTEANSANGHCIKNIMKVLTQDGHQVFCITNREHKEESCYEIDGVKYFSVKPRFVYVLSSYIERENISVFKKRSLKKIIAFLTKAKQLLFLGVWPWLSPCYTNRIYKALKALYLQEGADCVVPVYTQIDTLIAAKKLKKHYPNICYIPYFLDSLSGGYGLTLFTKKQTIKKGLRWERKLLNNANQIVMMQSSKSHHEVYSVNQPYYQRIQYFDLPLLSETKVDVCLLNLNQNKKNLLYVGTLPHGIRSPKYFLETIRLLKGADWEFYFIGTEDCQILNEVAKLDGRIHVLGKIPREMALCYEMQANVLVNIGNTNPNMTPSKIFEYMSMGKPIISTKPIKNEPSLPYLSKYPKVLLLDENALPPKEAAEQIEAFCNTLHNVGFETVRNLFYQNTPNAFAHFLENIKEEL